MRKIVSLTVRFYIYATKLIYLFCNSNFFVDYLRKS